FVELVPNFGRRIAVDLEEMREKLQRAVLSP
ncbi:guanylate cyclase, partial [Brucella neotomae 5K33]